MKKSKKKTQYTLLKGEGIHQHTLYGEFMVNTINEVDNLTITKDSVLKHENPDGSFGEHQPLQIKSGKWVMGRQVEYNPFERNVSRVWD